MNVVNWTKEEAKNFLVNYHMMNQRNPLEGYDSILTVFDRIKSIQYDPLNVVGTNPDLVLQARIKDYDVSFLNKALYEDRIIIDGWDKQMNIYNTEDFSFFQQVREDRAQLSKDSIQKYLNIDIEEYIDEVREILQTGPKFSSEIKIGDSNKSKWGPKKPSSAVLDYMFHIGEIGVVKRRGTQKQYDFMNNLIQVTPEPYNNSEFIKEYTFRRINSLGLTWMKNGVAWSGYGISKKTKRQEAIKSLLKEDRITKVLIEGIEKEFYIPTKSLTTPMNVVNNVSFIAPLDNLIWDRDLILELFNFDYKWEVYTPIKSRRWGYYVLPILYKSDFIGRIEFEQQRNSDPLIIKSVLYEENIVINNEIVEAFEKALHQFKDYLGASSIKNIKKIRQN